MTFKVAENSSNTVDKILRDIGAELQKLLFYSISCILIILMSEIQGFNLFSRMRLQIHISFYL